MYTTVRIALLALAAVGLLCIVSRAVWQRGKRVVIGKQAIDVNIRRGKHNALLGAHVTIEIPWGLQFSFERENWFDRLAKSLGLAREWQTGDRPFDGRVYLLCDDPLVLETLSINDRLRATLLRLLATPGRALHAEDGRLWIVCGAEEEAREMSDAELQRRFAGKFGADLDLVRGGLTSIVGSRFGTSRDPAVGPRAWISWMSGACALTGLIGGIYSLYLDRQQVVHDSIVHWSNGITLAAAVGLGVFLAVFLSGTSVVHRVLVDILRAAIPGIWLVACGMSTWGNEYLDRSTPATYSVRVQHTYRTKSKSAYTYHLLVESWPDPRASRKVRIDAAVAGFVRSGGCVDVIWRRGALGDGWVAGYRPNTNDRCGGALVE